ncbi:MAG: hypothetical protein ACQETX_00310 [Pseudomonadota bacterium]
MNKLYLPAVGFALTAILALPVVAQNNPGLEGYEGGHVATETAYHTGTSLPSFDASGAGIGSPLADNPGLEGYSGDGSLNQNARFGTWDAVPQLAARPGFIEYYNLNGYRQIDDAPPTVEVHGRNYGR